jgi:lactate racemase
MKLDIAYGRGRMPVTMPDSTHVIAPKHIPGLSDEHAAFVAAVRSPEGARPLRESVPATGSVAIVIADITRPSPSHKLVPWILKECGLGPDRAFIVNGTGTHRANTQAELEQMLGKDIAREYRVVNHNAFDAASVEYIGTTGTGSRVSVNKEYLHAGFKIVTGFIEPHFFAGFSGGPKGVVPAVASIETVLHLHSAKMIASPDATWGTIMDNPIQDELTESALMTHPDFVVNVTLNREKQITSVWAGDIVKAHRLGCEFARDAVMQPVQAPYDVVVTTNAGYPLDQNLYQAVKGMSAAASIVREGGAIITAAECCDGLPDHGNFRAILSKYRDPETMRLAIEGYPETIHDQWEAQVLALIVKKARVYLVSDLPDGEARLAFTIPVKSVEEALAIEESRGAKTFACLPEGPYTIPYLSA